MAKTANLYARIEPEVKDKAESILQVLGIPVSNAINMFYKQIILQNGIPFDVKIPDKHPNNINKMTAQEINKALETGYNNILEGKTKTANEVFKGLSEKYGIDL